MATITFSDARQMATDSNKWMEKVSNFLNDPNNPKPTDIYPTQKLAFELNKADVTALLEGDRIIGVLGYESGSDSLTVILVSTNEDGKPSDTNEPRQTWPLLKTMSELPDVLNTYLTPKE